MFIYNISDTFLNDEVDFPFNIYNKDGKYIDDFWDNIETVIESLNNDTNNKVRFIWIEAEGYCQTEVFLRRILKKQNTYPVLYLHWIDYVEKYDSKTKDPIGTEIRKVYENRKYFSDHSGIKICVIDHAEKIERYEYFTELESGFHNNPFIFIFLLKRGTFSNKVNWDQVLNHANNNNNIGIIRSENNFYQVQKYDKLICREIIKSTISNVDVKNKCIDILETLNDDLCRVYYFDLFISLLKGYNSSEDLPESFNDTTLLEEIYSNAKEGVVRHLFGATSLEGYIQSYYSSDFVQNSRLDDQKREPIDNYAWAYGIIYCAIQDDDNYYNKAIELLFSNKKNGNGKDALEQIENINSHIISISLDSSKAPNVNFSLESYLFHTVEYSLCSALVTSILLNNAYNKIDNKLCESIFIKLCQKYTKIIEEPTDIYYWVLLGFEIGKMLKNYSSDTVLKGLNSIFEIISDEYVIPKTNENGIAVIPVTNFEYQKFVNDKGYLLYLKLDEEYPLKTIANEYYKEIIDFLSVALSGKEKKYTKYLANILKGYDWIQYKHIAYIYSQKESNIINTIYESIIENNYSVPLFHPAWWSDGNNSSFENPFCNPLQPVVSINILEARAYANWLSKKINKNVRIVKYDPDYISIIGDTDSKNGLTQRGIFLEYIDSVCSFINSSENSEWFYGDCNTKIKEPSPVALPNTLFYGVYDFIGNVFELQDTVFKYNYGRKFKKLSERFIRKKNHYLIDYNCYGGGLQRTKTNWPPNYMGQVPAFLRNQDIGFRIVIDGNESIGTEYKHINSRTLEYTDDFLSTFIPLSNQFNHKLLLEQIEIESVDVPQHNVYKTFMFTSEDDSIVFFKYQDKHNEYIMLFNCGYHIYAYYLQQIASVNIDESFNKVEMVVKKPVISNEPATRKKYNNKDFSNVISLVEIYNNGNKETFLAESINISNGLFTINTTNIAKNKKSQFCLAGNYKIIFGKENESDKKEYYETIKTKLGTDFFLPDWIDLVDFIHFISMSIPKSDKIDVETIITAITAIDTSDLHKRINEKNFSMIEKNRRKKYESKQ